MKRVKVEKADLSEEMERCATRMAKMSTAQNRLPEEEHVVTIWMFVVGYKKRKSIISNPHTTMKIAELKRRTLIKAGFKCGPITKIKLPCE